MASMPFLQNVDYSTGQFYCDVGFACFAVFVLPIFVPFLFNDEIKDDLIQSFSPFPRFSASLYLVTIFYQVYLWAEGERKLHPLNGVVCFIRMISLVLFWEIAFLIFCGRSFLISIPVHSWIQVCQTAGILVSFLAFYDVIPHHPESHSMEIGSDWRHRMRRFFLGRHLTPLIGHMDLKFFWVGRVGMGLWFIVAFRCFLLCVSLCESFAHFFASLCGFVLTVAYIYDFYQNESWYTQTIDMIHDRFGFMMAWGSIVWMPYVYSYSMYCIALYPPKSVLPSLTFLTIGMLCVMLFRQINGYRIWARAVLRGLLPNDNTYQWKPEGLQVQPVHGGDSTYLITSGPYSFSRHPNYLVDLGWAFSICGLSGSFSGFLFFCFLLILLINRCFRDEKRCLGRYGQDKWNEYCQRIPFRIIPHVF